MFLYLVGVVVGLSILAAIHGAALTLAGRFTQLEVLYDDRLHPLTFRKAFNVSFAMMAFCGFAVFSLHTLYPNLDQHPSRFYGTLAAVILVVSYLVTLAGLSLRPREGIRVFGLYMLLALGCQSALGGVAWLFWTYT